VQTAAALLKTVTVECALGDLHNSTTNTNTTTSANNHGGGWQGDGNASWDIKVGDLCVPVMDFDFEGSNACFDKTAIALPLSEKMGSAYNPGKSFFDTPLPLTQARSLAQHSSRCGRRGGMPNQWEEE